LGKNAETTTGRHLRCRSLGAVATVLAALAVGCGSDGDGPRRQVLEPADSAYAARADAICAQALAETRRLGKAASRSTVGGSDPLTLTTERLIEPGLAIREQLANRLRALPDPQRGAAAVTAFVELFDPLEALTRERLRVGREGNLEEAQRLEELMRGLADEQQAAAQQAGLETCAADFAAAAFALEAAN
jgi:hypothetical protein